MEIDEGEQSPIMAEATASILSRELDELCGEQVLTDNAAAGQSIALPAAKTVGPIMAANWQCILLVVSGLAPLDPAPG
jgi:hypothetical protein